jgi:hypothetical protein
MAGWCSRSTRSAPSSGDRFASTGHSSCAGAGVGLGSFLAASGGGAACRIGRGQPLPQGLPSATGFGGQEAADTRRAALTWPAVGARAIKKIANLIALSRREVVASLKGHCARFAQPHFHTEARAPRAAPQRSRVMWNASTLGSRRSRPNFECVRSIPCVPRR